jgi:hypothetical protein
VIDDLSAPQLTHQLDLFLQAFAACGERDTERFVLDGVPAGADAQSQPAITQAGDLSSLLRHQNGLSLRQDENPRPQSDPGGCRSEEPTQDERLVEWHGLVIRTPQGAITIRVDRRDDVIEQHDLAVAEALRGVRPRTDRPGVVADLTGGEHGSELHGSPFFRSADSWPS